MDIPAVETAGFKMIDVVRVLLKVMHLFIGSKWTKLFDINF